MIAGTQKWTSVKIIIQMPPGFFAGFSSSILSLHSQRSTLWLNLLALPAAAFEKDNTDAGDEGFGGDDREKNAVRVHPSRDRQEICQRNFQQPKAKEIDECWRHGVSRAVERLQHYHAVGVGDVSVAQDTEAGSRQGDNRGIVSEKANDGFGEEDEDHADDAKEEHVVKTGAPNGFFGALGLLCAKILTDQSCGRIAESPGRQNDKD